MNLLIYKGNNIQIYRYTEILAYYDIDTPDVKDNKYNTIVLGDIKIHL